MAETFEYGIDFKNISISLSEIGEVIGYPESKIPEMVKKEASTTLEEAGRICRIKGGFKIYNSIEIKEKNISIENKSLTTKKIITRALKGSDSLSIIVCTAGEEISNWSRRLFKDENNITGYIADIIASLIVEKATDIIQDYVRKEASLLSMKITNRYSPGYCGWHVSDQHQLFSLLPDKFCGISLNESALMNPLKSISGIIGIGKTMVQEDYPCLTCNKTNCIYSRKK